MQKLVTLIVMTITLFFSAVGEEQLESAHSDCAGTVLASNSVPSDVAEIAAPVSAETSPKFHPCHIGHCAFLVVAQSPLAAVVSVVLSHTEFAPGAPLSGFRSETLRPPSRA